MVRILPLSLLTPIVSAIIWPRLLDSATCDTNTRKSGTLIILTLPGILIFDTRWFGSALQLLSTECLVS